MLGSITSRRNRSTASLSAALMPKVATLQLSAPTLSAPYVGSSPGSAKAIAHERGLRGLAAREPYASSRRLTSAAHRQRRTPERA